MKINDLSLKNLTAFEQANFKFCDGINVLIGTNGTGKTHAMKAMYAVVPTSSDWNKIFNIKNLNNLIRNNNNDDEHVSFSKNTTIIQEMIYKTFSFQKNNIEAAKIKLSISNFEKISPIYLPTIEMLSIYDNFFATYEKREIPYDKICYDLALALNAAVLRKTHADYQSIEPIIRCLC